MRKNLDEFYSHPMVTSEMIDLVKDAKRKIKNGTFTEGRQDLGDGVFVLFQDYVTKSSYLCDVEAHRKRIDIQVVLEGQEVIEVYPVSELKEKTPYDESKDVAFYHEGEKHTDLEMFADMFCIFYPENAHKPFVNLDGEHRVKKLIFKLFV